jgi:hypothetical protein
VERIGVEGSEFEAEAKRGDTVGSVDIADTMRTVKTMCSGSEEGVIAAVAELVAVKVIRIVVLA